MASVMPGARSILTSELSRNLSRSKPALVSVLVFAALLLLGLLAPLIAPYDPYDMSSFNLMDSLLPPAWVEGGVAHHPLGTDNQGRDLLSGLLYGLRISLIVGIVSVALSALIGVSLGLVSGYVRGPLEAFIMRFAEVQQTFPAILIALLLDGLLRGLFPTASSNHGGYWMVIVAIALSNWVEYARAVRASTLVEAGKDYVLAAQMIERPALVIMFRHILRNVSGPILVIGTISLGAAIMTEATLSFLGMGVPATQPSLGTLIRIGNQYLFSGEWWMTLFPGALLALVVLAINFVGDWLRDLLNPRLR